MAAVGTSPSSRRAWIEILWQKNSLTRETVALLAEGVDRNSTSYSAARGALKSPSSRRAWIEICICAPCPLPA